MSMSTPNLQPFIEPVPTCIQTTKLAKLLEIFSQNQCDRVVVVNEGHSPLALVSLRRLMPHLIAGLASTDPSPDRGVGESGSQFRTPLDLDRPIGSLQNPGSPALTTPLLEPLATLSAHLSLSQFWPYLQDQPELPDEGLEWAFVDAGGRFLGMLDRRRMLQFLAAHSLVDRATSFRLGADTAQQFEETPETLDRLSGNSEHPSKLAQHSLLKTLHPLIKLLKKLPLPLRLQTNTGKVISRNLAWRRHFPVIPDGIENPNETPETPKTSPSQTMSVLADPSLAEIGGWRPIDSEPATSPVAFCPIPTGHEKVWQFINIPLGIVLPPQKAIAQPDSEPQVTSPSVLNRRETPNPGAHQAHQTLSPAISSRKVKDKNEIGLAAREGDAGTSLPFGKANRPQDSAAARPEAGPNEDSELGKVGAPSGDRERGDWGLGTGTKKSPIPDPQSSVLDASPANLNSEETLCLLLAQDVTDQHQVAKELAAKNADLVQLNRLKDEFLACISHELKTPLTAVLGLSSLLKDRAIGPLNERQTRYARLIYQSGRHLMTVVNDILDLTRIETGQLELILEPVNVLATCDRAYKQAQQNHTSSESSQTTASLGDDADDAENETPFAVEIEADVQTLIADEMRLRQMLVNLLSNALKFTEPGGAIGLKVSRWEGWIAFTVWDTGIGIPDHKQHLIFQKFQQLENPLTRRFEGAGLGLVLTQRLARLHGGDVTFISSEGKGSQFTVLLPPCPPQPSTLLGETTTHRHRLVLIVEAVPRFIEALSEQLIELGYRVVIARTGTEALEKARRFSPEVVFINPVLPLLSGWDVLTLLKSDEATDRIPAIVTATQAEKELAFQNRADGFLSLPVQASALRQKLAHIHERSRDSATKITVLRLNTIASTQDGSDDRADIGSMPEIAELMADLNSLLHRHNYRVLESDELEQAELLARVWQPNVLLLNSAAGLYDPLAYFRQLSQYSSLASLPLVALEQEIARSANQVPGLTVFSGFWASGAQSPPTALLHVIQLAAGITWKPNILVVDISTLPDLSVSPVYGSHSSESIVPFSSFQSESLPALIQYIQTAGFKGLMGRSWSEMLQFLEHQSIDLLLICGRPAIPPPALLEALVSLGQRAAKPPILAIAQRSDSVAKTERSRSAQDVSKPLKNVDESFREVEMSDELKAQSFSQTSPLNPSQTLLDRVLQEIAIEILPPDVSMAALLETINRILVKS